MKKVVFACVENAGRSQMAAAFFNQLADRARAAALSAGTRPASRVHPSVVAAMREVGIDLEGARPQRLTPDVTRDAAWLVTMGCGEECPVLPGVGREDWPLPDPKGQDVESVRAIRDQIAARLAAFIHRERLGRVVIAEGDSRDLPRVLAFLGANGLPGDGLEHATDLLMARVGATILGTAALEACGGEALLRSVAVDPALRGTGLGQDLTRAALEAAKRRGVHRVFLLTETAARFFPRFGFTEIARDAVPEAIRRTVEFASACPASAGVMVLEID
jgi:arsenate reductase